MVCRAWDAEAGHGSKAATQPGRAVGRLEGPGDGANRRVAFRADARCLGLVSGGGALQGLVASWSASGAMYVGMWQ